MNPFDIQKQIDRALTKAIKPHAQLLKEAFGQLVEAHSEEFEEAVTGVDTTDGIGMALQFLDQEFFNGSFGREVLEENEAHEDFRFCENQWFEKGR